MYKSIKYKREEIAKLAQVGAGSNKILKMINDRIETLSNSAIKELYRKIDFLEKQLIESNLLKDALGEVVIEFGKVSGRDIKQLNSMEFTYFDLSAEYLSNGTEGNYFFRIWNQSSQYVEKEKCEVPSLIVAIYENGLGEEKALHYIGNCIFNVCPRKEGDYVAVSFLNYIESALR